MKFRINQEKASKSLKVKKSSGKIFMANFLFQSLIQCYKANKPQNDMYSSYSSSKMFPRKLLQNVYLKHFMCFNVCFFSIVYDFF